MLALGILWPLACALKTRLLALLHTWIASEQAGLLEGRAQLGVQIKQGTGNSVTHSADLAGDAAAAHLDQYVEARGVAGKLQRANKLLLEQVTRAEILDDLFAVDDELAAARK